jgi:hypothetical protein
MKQTTRSLVTVLVALAVAGAIGGAALWVGKDTKKQAEQKEKSAKLFDGLDKAKVRSVKLMRDGKVVALAARESATSPWKIQEPVQADADAAQIDAMVNGLADLKQKSELGEVDTAQYGLDKPKAAVTVKTEDGKELSAEFGESNPFDASVYMRKGGEKTVRIADGYAKAPFEKQLLDLRDKRVLRIAEGAQVQRIEVTGTTPSYVLEKDGQSWKLEAPQAEAADTGTADRIVNALRALRGTAIAAESADAALLKQDGLAPPKIGVQVSLTAPGGNVVKQTLLLGQPGPQKGSVAVKTYAKRDDASAVYEVDQQILKDLQKDIFDLQDKMLVHAAHDDVHKSSSSRRGSRRSSSSGGRTSPGTADSPTRPTRCSSPGRGRPRSGRLRDPSSP